MVDPNGAVLKIRSVRIRGFDSIFGALLRPLQPGMKLNLKGGFIIGPHVVTTMEVVQPVCLTIFNLSPTQKTCLYTNGNQASVRARAIIISSLGSIRQGSAVIALDHSFSKFHSLPPSTRKKALQGLL